MARTIQHKRGLEKNLPTLKPGEMAFTTDTKKVFVGSDEGNIDITNSVDVSKLATKETTDTLSSQLAEAVQKMSYPEKQSYFYNNFFKKIKNGTSAKISCLGSSTTYGQDLVSADKRPAPTTVLPDGSTHWAERAATTYPEALSTFLNSIYKNITVENRGYSGDNAEMGYNRWITPVGSDLTIISYGINDVLADGNPSKGDISVFLSWMRKIVERELDWGSAVVLLIPQKRRYTTDGWLRTFLQSIYSLGQEYNIPVIDTEPTMANYPTSIFSDDGHYNGTGYQIYGAKIASLLVGGGAQFPLRVTSGSTLLTRATLDNIIHNNLAYPSYGGFATPNETPQGSVVTRFDDGGKVVYSFYCESDNMIVFPALFGTDDNISFTLKLDFGVDQPEHSIDYTLGHYSPVNDNKPASVVRINRNEFNRSDRNAHALGFFTSKENSKYLHIATKGWHTLTIECSRTMPVVGDCALLGIEFIDYQTLMNKHQINTNVNKPSGFYSFQVGNIESQDFPSTTIPLNTIENALNLTFADDQFWRNPALNVTINSHLYGVISYVLVLGGKNTGDNFYIAKETKTYSSNGTFDNATARILTGISYDVNSRSLTLTWGGNIARRCTVSITVL